MKKSMEYKLNRINLKSYKLLSACLLIILIVLSSCAVRKGIQHFLSTPPLSNTHSGKMNKTGLTANGKLDVPSTACEKLTDAKDNLLSFVSLHNSENETFMVLYFVLPAFLISLLAVFSDHFQLPIPYSLLRWPKLSLFIQNRLLLI
jgi:hypothetical protein